MQVSKPVGQVAHNEESTQVTEGPPYGIETYV